MKTKNKRKHSSDSSEEPSKEMQDAYVQGINGSEESEAYAFEPVSSTSTKNTENTVNKTKKQKQRISDDICHKPKHKKHKTDEKESSESQQIVDSKGMTETPNIDSVSFGALSLSSTDTNCPEKSVEMTKIHKWKDANDTPNKHKKKKHKTGERKSSESQQIVNSQGMTETPNIDSVWFGSLSSTDTNSHEESVKMMKTHKWKDSVGTPKKHKKNKHKTGEKESSESQQIVNSQRMIEIPDIDSVVTNSREESVKMMKTHKWKDSIGTPNKQKKKKQKNTEKESSKAQELDVSGYHEPITETSSVDLGKILGSSAQKVIYEADSTKSVDYKTTTKSYPLLSKSDNGQSLGRLAEFKSHNLVSYGAWRKICKDLKKDGKKYNTGRFTLEENEQLRKNWMKLTKACPFEQPHVILMNNHFPDLKNDIENYVKDTNFYVRLGKHINRPLYNVYIRARKMFHPGNGKGSYRNKEIEMLKQQYHEHGSQWQKIGQYMNRSGQSLNDKFKRLKTTVVSGRWSHEEEVQLREAVKSAIGDHSSEEDAYFNFPWIEIARSMPTRNAKQCRDHWLNMLAFGNEGKNRFGKEDKIRLIYEIIATNASHESEINWIELKSKFNVPTPQSLQYKWYLLRVKVPDFQRCSLREVLEYLERNVVPGMRAVLKKKRGDTTLVSLPSSETPPKSSTPDKEIEGDKGEELRLCSFSEASPAWRKCFPQMAEAVDWLNANRQIFRQAVLEPRVVSMSECEVEMLIALDAESVTPTYHVAEATSFLFEDSDDIDLFMQKVRVDLNLHINCAML